MTDHVVLDKRTFKALAVDTRVDILKLLVERQHTLSELSDILGLRHSTIKEHIDVLVQAELIKGDTDGRKWKYYALTFKGRQFIQPKEVKVFFAFCLTLLGAIAAATTSVYTYFAAVPGTAEAVQSAQMADAGIAAMEFKAVAVESAASASPVSGVVVASIVAVILLTIISAFLLGALLKKPRVVVVSKKNETQTTQVKP